jgi:hypothetical protein
MYIKFARNTTKKSTKCNPQTPLDCLQAQAAASSTTLSRSDSWGIPRNFVLILNPFFAFLTPKVGNDGKSPKVSSCLILKLTYGSKFQRCDNTAATRLYPFGSRAHNLAFRRQPTLKGHPPRTQRPQHPLCANSSQGLQSPPHHTFGN